jgi:hypothetical protein
VCHEFIAEACDFSSIPPAFLGALTANESGGRAKAVRFEPGVYRHLKAIASGQQTSYAGIRPEDLAAEFGEVLHPKAGEFHAHYFAEAPNRFQDLSVLEDAALRDLASSWGFTQIMGYHMVGRRGTVHDLLDPRFHYRLATQILAEFAEDFQLDPRCEFEELFRCWNTGQPYGKTTDPAYVQMGLRRMELYRAQIAAPATARLEIEAEETVSGVR